MPLKSQTIEIPLVKGLGQSKDSRHVQPPNTLEATNVQTPSMGSFDRAFGFTKLTTTGSGSDTVFGQTDTAAPCTLLAHEGQLVHMTSSGCYTYDPVRTLWSRPSSNSLYPLRAKEILNISTNDQAVFPDIAVAGGVMVVVWEDTVADAVYAMFLDADTLAVLEAPAIVDATKFVTRPQLASAGQYVMLIAGDGTGDYYRGIYDSSATGSHSFGTFSSAVAATAWTVASNDSDKFAVVITSGGNINVITITASTNVAIDATAFADAGDPVLWWDTTNDIIHCGGVVAGDVVYRRYPVDASGLLSAATSATIVTAASLPDWLTGSSVLAIAPIGATSVGLWVTVSPIDINAAVPEARIGTAVYVVNQTGAIALQNSHETPRTALASKAITPSATPWPVWISHNYEDGQYPAYFVSSGTTANNNAPYEAILGRILENPTTTFNSFMPNLVEYDGKLYTVLTQLMVAAVGSIAETSQIVLMELELPSQYQRPSIVTDSGLVVGAGCIGLYDGIRGASISPHDAPLFFDRAAVAGTGILVNPGAETVVVNYALTFVITWRDAFGKIHRSAPSEPTTYAVGFDIGDGKYNDQTIRLLLPNTSINGDLGTVEKIEVYQGQASSDTSADPDAALAATRNLLVVLEPTPDATLAALHTITVPSQNTESGVVEYVQAGELSSDPTLAPLAIAANAERVFYLPPSGDEVRYSKPRALTRAFEFNDSLALQVPAEGGKATALAVMDDKLVVFKRGSIYVTSVSGGPDANGTGSFPALRQIPADAGTEHAQSVVVIPQGVCFKSDRGIYLLDRSLRLSFLGGDARLQTDYETVTYATLVARDGEVRFGLESVEQMLVYNYILDSWLLRDPIPPLTAVDSGSAFFVGASDGGVFEQGFGYLTPENSSSDIVSVIRSPWLHLNGIDGYERIRRVLLSGASTGHGITVKIRYNYSETVVDTFTIPLDDVGSGNFLIRVKPSRGKAEAISVSIENSGTIKGAGGEFALRGMQIEAVMKDGARRVTYHTTSGG